jgi:hypothetical protein
MCRIVSTGIRGKALEYYSLGDDFSEEQEIEKSLVVGDDGEEEIRDYLKNEKQKFIKLACDYRTNLTH